MWTEECSHLCDNCKWQEEHQWEYRALCLSLCWWPMTPSSNSQHLLVPQKKLPWSLWISTNTNTINQAGTQFLGFVFKLMGFYSCWVPKKNPYYGDKSTNVCSWRMTASCTKVLMTFTVPAWSQRVVRLLGLCLLGTWNPSCPWNPRLPLEPLLLSVTVPTNRPLMHHALGLNVETQTPSRLSRIEKSLSISSNTTVLETGHKLKLPGLWTT